MRGCPTAYASATILSPDYNSSPGIGPERIPQSCSPDTSWISSLATIGIRNATSGQVGEQAGKMANSTEHDGSRVVCRLPDIIAFDLSEGHTLASTPLCVHTRNCGEWRKGSVSKASALIRPWKASVFLGLSASSTNALRDPMVLGDNEADNVERGKARQEMESWRWSGERQRQKNTRKTR